MTASYNPNDLGMIYICSSIPVGLSCRAREVMVATSVMQDFSNELNSR